MRQRTRRTWALALVSALAAVGLELLVVRPLAQRSDAAGSVWVLVGVGLAFTLADLLAGQARIGRTTYTYSSACLPLVLGLTLVRPDILVHGRVLGALAALVVARRRRLETSALETAVLATEAALAVGVWHLVVGGHPTHGPREWIGLAAVILVCGGLRSAVAVLDARRDSGAGPLGLLRVDGPPMLIDLLHSVFALAAIYVLAVDGRAAWVVVVLVVAVVLAQRSHVRLQRHSERLEGLNRFIRAMGEHLDVTSIATIVLTHLSETLRGQLAIMILDDRYETDAAGSWSLRRGDPVPIKLDDGEPFAVWLCGSVGEGLVMPCRGRQSWKSAGPASVDAAPVKDLVAVPLRCDGRNVGVLAVIDRVGDSGTFGQEELGELTVLASHASVALENARLTDLLRLQVAEQEHQALHDELTGLPNRRLFRQELILALRRSDSLAVLLLDLDRFKEINDTLGHHVGDEMLCVAASRLAQTAPPGSVVSRFGGDEFGVLLRGCDEAAAVTAAEWMRHALARPYELGGLTFAVDVSIGAATSRGAPDTDALMRHADVAMYAAKAAGTGVEAYRADLDRNSPERLTLLADLRQALASGGLSLVFQPKVELRDGSVQGVEALVRWNHPKLGFIPPDEFIPIAEHSGLITRLTLYVLDNALAQREVWQRSGYTLGLAVNISPRSLLDPSFVEDVARILARVDVPASALTLEITETSIMEDPERAIVALRSLRELGVSLSVDDLGTGYSSLSYLLRLPVHEVKIDRSFLPGLTDDLDAKAIVTAIVELGHRLGRRVIAEGVEDEATYHHLRAIGCDAAQGYWMSRPLPSHRIMAWLDGWSAGHTRATAPLHAVR